MSFWTTYRKGTALLASLTCCGGLVARAQEAVSAPPQEESVVSGPLPAEPTSVTAFAPVGTPVAPGNNVSTPTAPSPTVHLQPGLSELPDAPGVEPLPDNGEPPRVAQGEVKTSVTGESRRFKYAFRLGLNTTYDDNVFLTEHNQRDDVYFVISPAVTIGFGDMLNRVDNFIRLDYAPSIFFYTSRDENDAVQHLVRVGGQYRFSKLTISGSQDIQILDGADLTSLDTGGGLTGRTNLDVSGRTRVNIFSTRVSANYALTGKVSMDVGGQAAINDYESLIDSESAAGNLYLNYDYSPKLSFGVGVTGGWEFVSTGPDQGFVQANVRGSYQISGKLSAVGSAGVEFRESTDQNDPDVTPVFEASAVYVPTDSTSITLSGSRRIIASAVLSSQDYQTTSVTLGVRQRFFQRFFVGLSGGYENSHYIAQLEGGKANRDDNYFFIQPSLEIPIREGLSATIFYLHRENSSSGGAGDFSFENNQVGTTGTISF